MFIYFKEYLGTLSFIDDIKNKKQIIKLLKFLTINPFSSFST